MHKQPTTEQDSAITQWQKLARQALWQPSRWPTLLFIGWLWFAAKLPHQGRTILGILLGKLLYHVAKKRRHITTTNIRIAFKELNTTAQQKMVRDIFIENSIGLLETGIPLFGDRKKLRQQTTFSGLTTLQKAAAKNCGIVLVGAHYSTLDMGGLLFSLFLPPTIIYRPHDNRLFDAFLLASRSTFAKAIIPKNQIKNLLKALQQGDIAWYPADQDYGKQYAVFAPFFGKTAATISVTAYLAKFNQSPVFIFSCHRQRQGGYQLNATPITEEYPTEDSSQDAALINRYLEAAIRRSPTEYLWMHRRYKTQPDNQPNPYDV